MRPVETRDMGVIKGHDDIQCADKNGVRAIDGQLKCKKGGTYAMPCFQMITVAALSVVPYC